MACALGGAALAAQPASLDDVAAGMEKAQGLLKEGQTGEAVRSLQGDVVAQLDVLIARYAGEATAGHAGPAGGGRQAELQGRRPDAAQAGAGVGRAAGRLAPRPAAGGGAAPGRRAPGLPPTEQKKIADTFSTGRLPARYAELLRGYNKRLAEQGTP